MSKALLIGTEPPAELGYHYVQEEPYDAVVIGSLSIAGLLRFAQEQVLSALAQGKTVLLYTPGLPESPKNRALAASLTAAQRELKKHGISCTGHAAHQITAAELDSYDCIYYMDASNARYLRRLFGDGAKKCQPLLDHDVADPWYTGDFTQTWADITEGCTRILEELQNG